MTALGLLGMIAVGLVAGFLTVCFIAGLVLILGMLK